MKTNEMYVVSVNTENYLSRGFWAVCTEKVENIWQVGDRFAIASKIKMENGLFMLKVELWQQK